MKKIIKRIIKVSLLILLGGILTIAAIILFPQPLFANKMKYEKFTVYSNKAIDTRIRPVLANALHLVAQSELYDSNYTYNIVLAYNSAYNAIDNWLLGEGPSARATLNNVVIKIRIDARENLAFPVFYKPCEANLSELIAHEMTHCLQAHKYGIFKFNPFSHPAFWKLEGYPEYVSKQQELSQNGYDLRSDIKRYMMLKSQSTDGWVSPADGACESPDYYYKGRLMVQYLMDIRHWDYDRVLKDTTPEDLIYRQMAGWCNKLLEKRTSSVRFCYNSPVPEILIYCFS